MSGTTFSSPNALFDPGSAVAQQSSIFGTASPFNTAPGLAAPQNQLAPQPAAATATGTLTDPTAQQTTQAPAVSPMWGTWGGFNGPGDPNSPYAGAVQQPSNPGYMTFAQAQAQAGMPGQNPFPLFDPSHPMWQVMFNEYTNMGQNDPRVLFQQMGQQAGGGYGGGSGGGVSGGGSGGHGQDASGQW